MAAEDKQHISDRIIEIEAAMVAPDFWSDKHKAQAAIKELGELKDTLEGLGKYDKGDAVITIFSGAGGDDAEDFSRILFDMYIKFFDRKGWGMKILHEHANDHGGYRNISFEVTGARAYGILKNESGVHRLVRVSPFNAKNQRHTSFSLVEVIPKFKKENASDFEIPEADLRFEFSRSSGPGGQNVNKRETAVRVVHIPTTIAVHADGERSQSDNREAALSILKAKLYKRQDDERKSKERGMYVSSTTEIEWGNQIRSYVFHPYKLIKDHRTGVEERNIDKVLDGELDEFIEAEKGL